MLQEIGRSFEIARVKVGVLVAKVLQELW
jgi:hypothetical protein